MSTILEQKLKGVNRTQTSLILTFLFGYSAWTLYLNWGNFQRKVAGEFRQPPPLIENPASESVYKEGVLSTSILTVKTVRKPVVVKPRGVTRDDNVMRLFCQILVMWFSVWHVERFFKQSFLILVGWRRTWRRLLGALLLLFLEKNKDSSEKLSTRFLRIN